MPLFLTSFVGEVEQRKTLQQSGRAERHYSDGYGRGSSEESQQRYHPYGHSSLWKNFVDTENPAEILTPAFIHFFSN